MLKPNFIFNSFLDITPEFLRDNNIKALLLDVDNTLTYAHKTKKLRDGAEKWFSLMRENDISLIVLSNAKPKRARAFGESIGLAALGGAAKPLPFGYLRAKRRLGLKSSEIAMVGDQLFTDIYGGNRMGLTTFLVTPIKNDETKFIVFKRKIEKMVLK